MPVAKYLRPSVGFYGFFLNNKDKIYVGQNGVLLTEAKLEKRMIKKKSAQITQLKTVRGHNNPA